MISKQRFVTFHDEKVNSICKVCSKESEISYQLHQKYFTILALPLFPMGKIVYWSCKSCSVIKELKSGATKTLDNFEQDILEDLKTNNRSQTDPKNYWGSILIFAIIALILMLAL
jgi:hypothetical protein